MVKHYFIIASLTKGAVMHSGNSKIFPVDIRVSGVRTVSHSVDPYEGLKGLDYIKARNLNRPVQKIVQTSAHASQASQRDTYK